MWNKPFPQSQIFLKYDIGSDGFVYVLTHFFNIYLLRKEMIPGTVPGGE